MWKVVVDEGSSWHNREYLTNVGRGGEGGAGVSGEKRDASKTNA